MCIFPLTMLAPPASMRAPCHLGVDSPLTDVKASTRRLNVWWFIYVQTHESLKHVQFVNPTEVVVKDETLRRPSLVSSLVCFSAWQEFGTATQLTDLVWSKNKSERMHREGLVCVWFITECVCVCSCVRLQAANDGLNLIIMDFSLFFSVALYNVHALWSTGNMTNWTKKVNSTQVPQRTA